ncbi:hypothetical protein GOBAR_DD19282 [Gossypium barbadense]|nr:hypothetical protein GOBAR_DD19282 [Gossypium barbadense]
MPRFCVLLWDLWNVYNNEVLQGGLTLLHVALTFPYSFHEEFRGHNLLNKSILPRSPREHRWYAPCIGSIKINVYAAWDKGARSRGLDVLRTMTMGSSFVRFVQRVLESAGEFVTLSPPVKLKGLPDFVNIS